jgi:hypothetical protein
MPTLALDDDELCALHGLLTDVTRQRSAFPPSPKRAWLSAGEAHEGGGGAEAENAAHQGPGLTPLLRAGYRSARVSQIKALDREQRVLPMMPGVPERRTHNYVRHGTTSLFAALDVASGFVIGKCYRRPPGDGVPQLPQRGRVPDGLDVHIIMDNYATHKTPKIKAWLARRPHYHMHFTPTSAFMDQPRRALVRRADQNASSACRHRLDAHAVTRADQSPHIGRAHLCSRLVPPRTHKRREPNRIASLDPWPAPPWPTSMNHANRDLVILKIYQRLKSAKVMLVALACSNIPADLIIETAMHFKKRPRFVQTREG